jgi:hypothetical protein
MIFRQIINIVAIVTVIGVNILANTLPLNGQGTGEISDRFDVYFMPAGYTFSIWTLIYIGLVTFAVYQALPAQQQNQRVRRLDAPFILSCLANIGWLFLWHYEVFLLTIVAMTVLLLSLIAIYRALDTGKIRVPAAEKWFVDIPFSLYLGWITVATITNVTVVLEYLDWNGWGISPMVWAIIMLAVGLGIAASITLPRADAAYMLVIAWAFAGIAVKQVDRPVVIAAWIGAVLALVLALWMLFRLSRSSVWAEERHFNKIEQEA